MEYERFLKKLKKERKKRGISLREAGVFLGVTGQYLSLWENNRAPLKMKDYFLLCELLEIAPKDLLEEDSRIKECQGIADRIKRLSERDMKIIKDLIMLMELSKEDL